MFFSAPTATKCSSSRHAFLLLHPSRARTISSDNSTIIPRLIYADNSWQRLGYEAKQRGKPLKANGHNGFLIRYEPTWGDLDVLVDIILALKPHNQNCLLTAFGMGLKDINYLQLARNACAHKNVETIKEFVNNTHLYYDVSQLKRPSDLAWSIKIGTHSFAFNTWLYEMRVIAKNAIRTI
jgi:hypothetical protein